MTTQEAIQIIRNYNAGIRSDSPAEQARLLGDAHGVVIRALSRCPVTEGEDWPGHISPAVTMREPT